MLHSWASLKWNTVVNLFCKKFLSKPHDSEMSFIAMFHNILSDDVESVAPFECRAADLIDFVEQMSARKMEFVSLDELLTMPLKNAEHRKCVISFDDGFESVYTFAAPILNARGIPFTVYITTSFIGEQGYLSSSQIIELARMPNCTVGMHGHEHEMFRFKTNNELAADYTKCREILEKITGESQFHYAFPYGSVHACSMKNCNLIRRQKVKSIAMTLPVRLYRFLLKNRYYLPRLDIPAWYYDY